MCFLGYLPDREWEWRTDGAEGDTETDRCADGVQTEECIKGMELVYTHTALFSYLKQC